MGNETSQLKGLKIDEKALEVTDHYSLNLGEIPETEKTAGKKQETSKKQVFAIFSCDTAVATNFDVEKQAPLARAIKCMKIYR